MPKDKTLFDPEERFARREGSRDDLRRYVEILIEELLERRQNHRPVRSIGGPDRRDEPHDRNRPLQLAEVFR